MSLPFPSDGTTSPPPPRIDPNSTSFLAASTSSARPQSVSTSYALGNHNLASDPWPPSRSDDWAYPDAASATVNPCSEDIEMDSIAPTTHRRRRSSLKTPANPAVNQSGSSRPRTPSVRNQFHGQDEPRISEEDDDTQNARAGDRANDSLSDEDLHDDEEAGLTKEDKRRKQRKKRRNTRLDQRVVRERITAEERKEGDQTVLRSLLVNGGLIVLWYFFSLCISLVTSPLSSYQAAGWHQAKKANARI